jgi:hypothetical protein
MYIEDLINRLNSDGQYMFADLIELFHADRTVIESLSTQVIMGNGFTEKQSTLAIRLVKKYLRVLSLALQTDITPFVNNPQFRLPTRVISSNRSIVVRKISDTTKRVISVIFPFDAECIASIKTYKKIVSNTGNNVNWNPDSRSWDFDLREENVDWISNNLQNSSFIVDELFQDIATQVDNVKNNLEKYIPMVVFEDNKFVFKNTTPNIPQPTGFDLVDTLVEARKYGITTWAEDIDIALDQLELDPMLYKFLTTASSTTFPIDKEKTTFSDIITILKHSLPCLVVVPGGSELRHLEICTKMIQKMNISTEEMTVLFRLDGETGKNCNNFVKATKLNNPVNADTKIVFISGKIPKPLLESKLNFSSILNLGISGVHYTLSNYLKNHNFVVNYSLKESDFVEL